jgi:hypothetical protein
MRHGRLSAVLFAVRVFENAIGSPILWSGRMFALRWELLYEVPPVYEPVAK